MTNQNNANAYNGTVKAINEHTARNSNDLYKVLLLDLNGSGTIPVYLTGKPLKNFVEGGFKVGDKIRVMGVFDIENQNGTKSQLSYKLKTDEFGELRVLAMKGIWVGVPKARTASNASNQAAENNAQQMEMVEAPAQEAPALQDDNPF